MTDAELIQHLGGPAKVAKLLQLSGRAVQRVHNWKTRGIPAAIKVQYPHLFMPEIIGRQSVRDPEDGCRDGA